MDHDDYEQEPPEAEQSDRPRDRKVDEAKAIILERYLGGGTNVYYSRQIEIWLEKQIYHWITKKALNELAAAKQIGFIEQGREKHKAHFFYPPRHCYPRRQIKEIIGLIAAFPRPILLRLSVLMARCW